MPQIEYNGEIHDFPDNFTDAQISEALALLPKQSSFDRQDTSKDTLQDNPWQRQVSSLAQQYIPAAMGVVGDVVGKTPIVGPLLAGGLGASGVGYADTISALMGYPRVPENNTENLKYIGKVAASNAIGSLLGHGAGYVAGQAPGVLASSALKQSKTLPIATRDANIAALLENRTPVTMSGIDKTQLINQDIENQVQNAINSFGRGDMPIPTSTVAGYLDDLKNGAFGNQVRPQNDLAAIMQGGKEFRDAQRFVSPDGFDAVNLNIPASQALIKKRATYQVLPKKAYGEMKGVDTEIDKTLARGLNEEMFNIVPELQHLNPKQASIIKLQSALVDAVKRKQNLNLTPLSIGASGWNPKTMISSVLDQPAVKSALAIATNEANKVIKKTGTGKAAQGGTSAMIQSLLAGNPIGQQ